ncbi:sulfatase-like hydrolase/transferase [Rhodobacteraceae bacterium 2CG4]|uniref:Sulfatase-like hydrolase/transferase n=1 Tax=Halovulum marinum TaxID=2662447 RepID=A0A6L5Z2H6_9RHOB|nr:sulfatase-like hydrolase/transferase [Halovulum marinum]MSU90766.1 sulfatase-like hydrolase/transferase [Halovulum marinum]
MADARPDIVVVLVDQMRRDALGFCGDPNVRTPVLDRMARGGLVFDAMCSTFPCCVPFRFSMMTGQYAHSRMVPALGYRMSPAERTLGEAVQAAGYRTGYVGKWHLHSLYGTVGGQSLAQANRRPIPASHRRGFDHWRGFELRNDYHDTWIFEDDASQPVRLEGYQTDALFALARDWVAAPRDDPGFLILSVEAPHPPFDAPEAAVAAVAARGPYAPRPNVDVAAISAFPPEWHRMLGDGRRMEDVPPEERDAIFTRSMQTYCAMIEVIDANMGALLSAVKSQPNGRETVVLFLSDHGELGGSHGLLGKAEPYEESVGVPFLAWATDPALVPPGRRCGAPVGTEDLFPTLTGLAGGHGPAAPGRDLSGLIAGGAEPEDDAVLLEFTAEVRPGRRYHDQTWRGIRTRHSKYVVIGNDDGVRPWMLFDLAADPCEQRNLVDAPAHAPARRDLHHRLAALLRRTGDDFPITLPGG